MHKDLADFYMQAVVATKLSRCTPFYRLHGFGECKVSNVNVLWVRMFLRGSSWVCRAPMPQAVCVLLSHCCVERREKCMTICCENRGSLHPDCVCTCVAFGNPFKWFVESFETVVVGHFCSPTTQVQPAHARSYLHGDRKNRVHSAVTCRKEGRRSRSGAPSTCGIQFWRISRPCRGTCC